MRRLAIGMALSALAIPASALAGFDNPAKHAPLDKRAAEIVIPGKRCSTVSNPFECKQQNAKSYPTPSRPTGPYRNRSCWWAHIMYRYHHPPGTRKPWMLAAMRGCILWRSDERYHSTFARAGLDDQFQSAMESTALQAIPKLIGGTI